MRILLMMLVFLFSGTRVQAHPGHDHDNVAEVAAGMRLWKSASGGSQFRAHLVVATQDRVEFVGGDGKPFTLPRWFLCDTDEAWIRQHVAEIQRLNERFVVLQGPDPKKPTPTIRQAFEPFKDKLKFRADDKYFYVESDGLPSHPMMKGIRSWQQQVPLPSRTQGTTPGGSR